MGGNPRRSWTEQSRLRRSRHLEEGGEGDDAGHGLEEDDCPAGREVERVVARVDS